MDRILRLFHSRVAATTAAISVLAAFLVVWPSVLGAWVGDQSQVLAAWVQALGAVLAICVAVGIAARDSNLRNRDLQERKDIERRAKDVNYRIARDIFTDTVEQFDKYFGQNNDMRHIAKTIVASNVDLIQQIAFKDLPSSSAAKDMFQMRLFVISIHATMERGGDSFEAITFADELRSDAIAYRDKPRGASGPLFEV